MRKRLLLLCLALCLTACEKGTPRDAYTLFFPGEEGDFGSAAYVEKTCYLERALSPDKKIEALLAALLERSAQEPYAGGIPRGTVLRDWSLKDEVLTLDFSWHYASLSGVELTLADYGLVKTLCQLPEVASLVILSEGEEMSYRDHQTLSEADVRMEIHRDTTAVRDLELFFPRRDGKGIATERRRVEAPEDVTLTMALLNALAQGPQSPELLRTLAPDEVLSAEVRGGICYLDLAASFSEMAPEDEDRSRLTLWSITESLCRMEGISALRFLGEGETLERYGKFSLLQTSTWTPENFRQGS